MLVVAAACASTLAFAFGTLVHRPLDGSEGNFLFEAARIRRGWPLYVDPREGAWQYGAVPSRYYVLYTPLWAGLLSLCPESIAPVAARLLSLGAWLGMFVWMAASAPRPRRGAAAAGAAFVVGLYPVTLFAASGRPDSVAVALAGVGLLRSMRRGSVGAVEAALFALAPFFKPNVFAAGVAVLVVDIVARRCRAWPAVAAACATSFACAGALQAVSHGAWVEHLVRSTWMHRSTSLWLEQMASRAPFFALPLGFCAWCALRAGSRTAVAALGASAVWAVWSLAKVGSASNYWMEPCVVGVAILAVCKPPRALSRARCVWAAVAITQVGWTGVAAVRSSLGALSFAHRKADRIADARRQCGARPADVVMADEVGLEVMLDGRLVEQPLVFTELARHDAYPVGLWIADVARPGVTCLILQSDWLERASGAHDPDHDLLPEALREPLKDRFVLASEGEGVWVYRAR